MSNCKHLSFSIINHEECPECGETDVHKIIDERGIAKLEMLIQEKDAEIERLREALQRFFDNSSIQTNHPDECEFAEVTLERLSDDSDPELEPRMPCNHPVLLYGIDPDGEPEFLRSTDDS